ncbi:NACHT domain-containing protein [Streptomyces sp. NPDC001663]|uniref:NACHT domain-containing protein n=1 Tax=Streptomyces sp. NPDC001663 TaxID=3364597 RepID=UPI0036BB886F
MAGRGRASTIAWAGATCVLVAGALVFTLGPAHAPLGVSDRSGLVSMVLALPGLVVAVIALLWARPGSHEGEAAAVARLAREVRAVGEPQWAHSLGGDLTAIDVTFTFRPYGNARAAALPSTPAGQLERVVEDFRAIRPSRLVITGEPGAGKTVLARKLVMELNLARTEQEPVPVMIALADWDEDEPLTDWVVRHLERDYGLSRSSARAVVEARMVLPVLDGLDEMDAAASPADRRRARATLEALDRYQDGTHAAPLVLTCRTEEYDAFETEGRHILDSARIEIDPVTSAQAHRFLSQRGAARRPARWQGVLDKLSAEPTGVLARALSTPWRLTLAATVYEQDGNPAQLIAATSTDEVADRLLGRYIAAATVNSRKAPGRYGSDEVHRRLALLARALGTGSAAETDLALLDLGRRIPRWQLEIVRGSIWAALIAVSAGAALVTEGLLTVWVVAAVLIPVIVLLASIWGGGAPPFALGIPVIGAPLWRVGFRLLLRKPWRADLPPLFMVLAVLLYVLVGPMAGLWNYWQVFVPAALALVLWCVLEAGTWIDTSACGPTSVLWGGAVYGAHLAALGALAIEATGSSPYAVSVFCWFMAILLVKTPGHLGYLAFVLWNSRCLPLRLARFLDWSVAAGLLRTSGVAYQFRHREFQEWLVRHPEPTSLP